MWQTIKNNLAFIGVCLLIFAAVFALAFVLQRTVLKKSLHKVSKVRYVAYVGMFSAVAGLLMLLEIPLPFAPDFYKLDFSEIPVLICGFFLGPVAGVTAEFIKIVIKLVLKSTSSAFVGDFANFCVGAALILPATVIYHVRKTRKSALIGMAVGVLVMTVFGAFMNAFYLLPTFSTLYGIPLDAIIGMGTAVNPAITSVSTLVLFAVVPFNLLKGIIVGVVTYLLYKRIGRLLLPGHAAG
ncbi:MAG: ECF transporter S component [Firmicutes bacterium]|nr:ECF transporter S component [Bacillota bacterium]